MFNNPNNTKLINQSSQKPKQRHSDFMTISGIKSSKTKLNNRDNYN